MQQQAADLIILQETLKKQGELIKSLVETVDKGLAAANPQGLANASWPPLQQLGSCPGSSSSPNLLQHVSQTSSKLIQRISLASKQLLIDYGPKAPDDPPRNKSINSQ